MKTVTISVKDEVFMTIEGLEKAESKFLFEKYAIEVEGSFFSYKRKIGAWDGKKNFYSKDNVTYLKLLEEILPYLEKWGYEIDLKDNRHFFAGVKGRIHENWFEGKSTKEVLLRPYQVEAINLALELQSGILLMATGSGKSFSIAGFCDVIGQEGLRAIVIVPSADLVEQTAKSFAICNIDHGCYSGAGKDLNHTHVIGTWQSIKNNPMLLKDFNAIIVDEAQGATAEIIGGLLTNHGVNVPFRLGFTGTIPKPKTDATTIRGVLGDVLYTVTAADLIRLGYLSDLEIEPIQITEKDEEDFPDYASEKSYISKQPDRLDFIANLTIDRANRYGNTLVIVNSIKQGQQLQKLIKDSVFLSGTTDNDIRAEWYATFENENNLIVIATTGIASVGISIDRIFNLMVIDAGKSFVRTIQTIGRSLRKGHDKDFAHVCDVFSGLKYGRKHWRERAKYYKEAGYTVLKLVKVKI